MPVKSVKIEKMVYTMGEIATSLGENVSLVRFWADKFPLLFKPRRNKKGNRLFSPDEYNTFLRLHHLVKDRGMKLESAAQLVIRGEAAENKKEEIVRKLTRIRKVLSDIEESL